MAGKFARVFASRYLSKSTPFVAKGRTCSWKEGWCLALPPTLDSDRYVSKQTFCEMFCHSLRIYFRIFSCRLSHSQLFAKPSWASTSRRMSSSTQRMHCATRRRASCLVRRGLCLPSPPKEVSSASLGRRVLFSAEDYREGGGALDWKEDTRLVRENGSYLLRPVSVSGRASTWCACGVSFSRVVPSAVSMTISTGREHQR